MMGKNVLRRGRCFEEKYPENELLEEKEQLNGSP